MNKDIKETKNFKDIKDLNRSLNELLKLSEGEVLSFSDYKNRKNGTTGTTEITGTTNAPEVEADNGGSNDNVKPTDNIVEIKDVIYQWSETDAEDPRWLFEQNKSYAYEDIQAKINEEDYRYYVKYDSIGYKKTGLLVNLLLNGEPTFKGDPFELPIRFDLGDGAKHGAEQVCIKGVINQWCQELFGKGNYTLNIPDVEYDIEGYKKKYGTKEENIDKYLAENPVELPVKTQDFSVKAVDDVKVGDIYYDSEVSDYNGNRYYTFFKVTKKTPARVWFERIEQNAIKIPVKEIDKHDGEVSLDDAIYIVPNPNKISDKQNYSLMDLTKPFRLTVAKWNNGTVVAQQGSGYSSTTLYPYKGEAMKESFNDKAKRKEVKDMANIYTKLNEELISVIKDSVKISEAVKPFKLTQKDINYLINDCGYRKEDMAQIQKAANSRLTKYEIDDKPATRDEALETLGREVFLDGLARSAFHWGAMRTTENGINVEFNSNKLHEK